MAYGIAFWASERSLGNDDNLTGVDDIPTLEEALSRFDELSAASWLSRQWQVGYVDGPEGPVSRTVNPAFTPEPDAADGEFAMQQGMAFGVRAYNEANGEDAAEGSDPEPSFR